VTPDLACQLLHAYLWPLSVAELHCPAQTPPFQSAAAFLTMLLCLRLPAAVCAAFRRAFPHHPLTPTSTAPAAPGGVAAVWLGHASVLVNMEGLTFITDPVFSERCSPVQFLGPRRCGEQQALAATIAMLLSSSRQSPAWPPSLRTTRRCGAKGQHGRNKWLCGSPFVPAITGRDRPALRRHHHSYPPVMQHQHVYSSVFLVVVTAGWCPTCSTQKTLLPPTWMAC
jgi:hypothetical protein